MPSFTPTILTTSPAEMDVISACIGDNTNQAKSDFDLGKAVKLDSTAGTYVLCADGDDIEGFIDSVRGDTVNGGFSFGGIQRAKRVEAVVGANQSGSMGVGDYVVADTQIAFGTLAKAQVKTGVAWSQSGTTPFAVTESTPVKHMWRCIRVAATGAVGEVVLLERQ